MSATAKRPKEKETSADSTALRTPLLNTEQRGFLDGTISTEKFFEDSYEASQRRAVEELYGGIGQSRLYPADLSTAIRSGNERPSRDAVLSLLILEEQRELRARLWALRAFFTLAIAVVLIALITYLATANTHTVPGLAALVAVVVSISATVVASLGLKYETSERRRAKTRREDAWKAIARHRKLETGP